MLKMPIKYQTLIFSYFHRSLKQTSNEQILPGFFGKYFDSGS
jgi:hypothetical protein